VGSSSDARLVPPPLKILENGGRHRCCDAEPELVSAGLGSLVDPSGPRPDLGGIRRAVAGSHAGRVRPSTHRGYEGLLRLYALPSLGDVPLAELHPLQLQDIYGKLLESGGPVRGALSAGTVLNLHRVLVQSLGSAVRWGLLPSNPAAAAQPPRPRRAELVAIDPDLMARILESAAGTPMEVPVAIALATGMRRGEILGLQWSDLNEDLTIAHVRRSLQPVGGLSFQEPKSSRSRRTVALPAFLRPYLERQRKDQEARRARNPGRWKDTGLVVDAGGGSPVHPDTLSSGWIRLVRQAGLPHLRFHDLRHGHATLMLLQGVHPKIVSERLGHASIGITLDIYSHVLPSMQSEAADAFDRLLNASRA
jgi:integrase